MDLRNQVAIVTGGAVRIGRALSLALADAGARVCVHYGSSREAAERTVSEIRRRGGDAVAVQADLSQPEQAAETVVAAAIRAFHRATILVNNAAIFEAGTLRVMTRDDWDRHHCINLLAPALLCRRFAEALSPDGVGAIVNMADWRALRPQPGHVAYTLSKAGLVCLTQILAQELAPRIRVNAIAPGAILPAVGSDMAAFERFAAQIPLARTGGPDDIVQAALYLLQSEFVTGEILHVTGGQQLRVPAAGTVPT